MGKPGQLECLVKIKSKSGFYVEQRSSEALTEGLSLQSLCCDMALGLVLDNVRFFKDLLVVSRCFLFSEWPKKMS